MAGLMSALALRESGAFTTIDVFEQTRTPSTAGAGLNIPPHGARLSPWLRVGLDGGDPASYAAAVEALRSLVDVGGGSGVIVRAPLEVKRAVDVWGPAGDAVSLMRRVKQQYDPAGTMSPGRFVGGI